MATCLSPLPSPTKRTTPCARAPEGSATRAIASAPQVVVERGRLEKALLADFGEAKEIKRTLTAHGTRAGTPLYMAPEMKQEEDAKGPKADVFSAGVVSTISIPSAQQQRVRRC